MDKPGDNYMTNHEELWKKVVDNLRETMSPDSFNLWLQPLKPLSLNNDILELQVPNKYFSDWITVHQKENIEKILSAESGQTVRIHFQEVQEFPVLFPEETHLQIPVLVRPQLAESVVGLGVRKDDGDLPVRGPLHLLKRDFLFGQGVLDQLL